MQNVVNSKLDVGVPGLLYGILKEAIGRNNYSKQLDKVDIDADDTTTTVTINGTPFTFTETGASELKAYIANYLTGLINASAEPVTAYYTSGNDYFTVESDVVGTAMTVVGTASCTVTAQIGNAAAIDFGLYVCQDLVDDEKARVPISATDITDIKNTRGITIRSESVEQYYQTPGGPGYALNEEMSILKNGTIWVLVESAVTPQTAPYVRFIVSGATKLGGIRGDNDGGNAAALPNARFVSSAGIGELALLEIALP
jgi:hypothetical protein